MDTGTGTGGATLLEKAKEIRSIEWSPAERAAQDQESSAWRGAYASTGVEITSEVALVAFATLQVVLFNLIDTEGDLVAFGERLFGGAVMLAEAIQ